MKVLRKQELSIQAVGEFKVGDQIQVEKYTATCQRVTEQVALFLMDQYLDTIYPMNPEGANEGGYEASDLRWRIQREEVLSIFSSVRDMMAPFKNGDLLRIPYAEEFYNNIEYNYEPSDKKQWPLMKDRKNRIAIREGEGHESVWTQDKPDYTEMGWLLNKMMYDDSHFAAVDHYGNMSYNFASTPLKVRLVFQLRQPMHGEPHQTSNLSSF